MAEYESYYGLPSASMARLRRRINQMKAAGYPITDRMVRSFAEGEMSALADRASSMSIANRNINLQEEGLALSRERLEQQAQLQKAQAVGSMAGLGIQGAALYGIGKTKGWWGATQPALDATKNVVPLATSQTPQALAMTEPFAVDTSLALGAEGATAGTAGATAATTATESLLPSMGTMASGAGLVYGGAKLLEATEGVKEIPKELSEVGKFTADLFEKPIAAMLGFAGLGEGGTVICTELYKQGYLSNEVYINDAMYRNQVSDEEYIGYRILADPIVARMKKSPLFTRVVSWIGVPTATEMAHRANNSIKGTVMGKVMLSVFRPICGFVGRNIAGGAVWTQ